MKKLLLFLPACALLVGCENLHPEDFSRVPDGIGPHQASPDDPWPAPPPQAGPGSISSERVYDVLIAAGLPEDRTFVQGEEYMLPAKNWITGEFAKSFEDLKFTLGFVYAEESNDCRAFSELAVGFARWRHNKTTPGTTLAIGEFCYKRHCDLIHGHEIVATIGAENGKLVLRFFEPQNEMSEVDLSKCEIKSCLFCRF